MGNYSKLIGSVVGGVLGFAVAHFGLPEQFSSPEIVGAVTVLLAALATYLFPANVPSK